MNILKIKDPQGNWVDIPALKGDKGDKGDPGISPTIDSTLSQANQAADAKAVGDKIDEITLTIDETLTQSGQVADAKVTGDALNTKADQNGYYENLNVGVADQLASKNYIEDNEAYTFRPTGGGAKVGTRAFDTIVGGSIVWNQGVSFNVNKIPSARNGLTFTKDGDACIISGTVTGSNMTASGWFSLSDGTGFLTDDRLNHALLIITKHISGTVTDNAVKLNGGASSMAFGSSLMIGNNRIFKMGGAIGEQHRISINSPDGTVFDNYKFTMACFDLTAMFGSEIADYIYSLEQSTPGAGVAWFKKYFPNDYYEYNPGELMHVSDLQSHDTVEFNLWDEKWEVGVYNNANGFKASGSGRIRNKNFIPVFPNTTYYMKKDGWGAITIYGYNENRKYLGVNVLTSSYTFTTDAHTHYINFNTGVNTGSAYNNDICINLSGTRNGEYEPYTKHSYPLDSSLTLRGIPKLVDGKLIYDGDIYKPDGTVERRYGIVDLGTLTWQYTESTELFWCILASVRTGITANEPIPFICSKYVTSNRIGNSYVGEKQIGTGSSGGISNTTLIIKDASYTDVATFKTAMSGVYLIYELATPTTEQATPYQSSQIIDPYGTEEYVTTSIIPVGHQTQYPEDLRAKIESLPWDFANLIAPVETTYQATQNYTTGSLFIVDNTLYKATVNIANGGTITPNTNCAPTTLAEIIAAL